MKDSKPLPQQYFVEDGPVMLAQRPPDVEDVQLSQDLTMNGKQKRLSDISKYTVQFLTEKSAEDETKKAAYMKRMEEEDKRAEEIRLKTNLTELTAAKNETRPDKYITQASVKAAEPSSSLGKLFDFI